ncbi:MAG: hypothetical protein A3B68_05830 [Candidatus Melainabacteria bacterium RIFCSPHIGHO2_02_FULL_34_12]|nr:MAG: hypothetical protein A3B68_05830 [Candidatus Melainabacteria bacterium RIFCSPHIGHO2_02_FULL_34_12]
MNKHNKNISALIIVICIISIVISIFLPKSSENISISKTKFDRDSQFSFKPLSVHSPFKGERITVIKLDGIISDSGSNSFFKDLTSSNAVLELVNKATKDPSIKAIVLRINSPGGTVAASQEIYRALIKARKKKPIVVTMGDVAASGGYYIASASDAIFANPGTLTGSIGVITSYLNFHELLTMIGVKGIVFKAGEFKDIGNPTRPLTEQEKKILQALLDDTYDQFLNDVTKGRNIPREKVEKIAQGLIYTGKQAKKVGLVDHLGDYSKAVKFAQKLAKERFPELRRRYGKKDLPIEESWKSTSFFDVLIGSFSPINKINNPIENKILKTYSYSKFQPLWLLE